MISIHAPRTGSDYAACVIRLVCADFNPRSPHGERHNPPDDDLLAEVISIHAPRTGSDERLIDETVAICPFQSTLPARGATPPRPTIAMPTKNFNPRSPHGERLVSVSVAVGFVGFQSTLPARGATARMRSSSARAGYFNPRSPHGERRQIPSRCSWAGHFNPRSPHGERRYCGLVLCAWNGISIHAPRTGSDYALRAPYRKNADFNPRSPHGERLSGLQILSASSKHFNPRSPHGERLCRGGFHLPLLHISIHAPRTGSDPRGGDERGGGMAFQSTLPARGATRRFPA